MTNKEIIQISKSKPKKSQSCVPLNKTVTPNAYKDGEMIRILPTHIE